MGRSCETADRSLSGACGLTCEDEFAVLLVQLEPAPYVVGLTAELRRRWIGPIEVIFIGSALSQDWDYELNGPGEVLLSTNLWQAIREIHRRIGSGKYRLVHLAGWGHPILLAALLIAAWKRIRVAIESDTPRSFDTPLWKALIKRLFFPYLFKLPTVFLPAGSRQAAYLRFYGVTEARIRIARMTVDVAGIISYSSTFTSVLKSEALRRQSISHERTRFLYLGRLEPYKGLRELLEAFGRLAIERNDVALLVAGDGSMRQEIMSAILPPESFHYLGRLSGSRVWEAYNIADVFMLPSRFEPWGLVINEAMAAGLPVIVSDRAGCIDDLVQSGVNGIVVPALSPDCLLGAMRELSNDRERRQRMGAQGRRRIADWTLENEAVIVTLAWRNALA